MASRNGDDGSNVDEDYDWTPPSEAELKIMAARRERQEKVSKLLGEYLLKGYKMLGTTCSVCETILMRSKQGVDYCVACNELDSDTTKDDPALSSIAARSQALESQAKSSQTFLVETTEAPRLPRRTSGLVEYDETDRQPSYTNLASVCSTKTSPTDPLVASEDRRIMSVASDSLLTVLDQLASATEKLKQSSSVETSRQLCLLIRDSAHAAEHLKRLLSGTSDA